MDTQVTATLVERTLSRYSQLTVLPGSCRQAAAHAADPQCASSPT